MYIALLTKRGHNTGIYIYLYLYKNALFINRNLSCFSAVFTVQLPPRVGDSVAHGEAHTYISAVYTLVQEGPSGGETDGQTDRQTDRQTRSGSVHKLKQRSHGCVGG